MKFRQNISLLLLLLFVKTSFSQTRQINYAPWQHPVLQSLEKKPKSLIKFYHSTDDDYYIPLAVLNKASHQLYYVTTFGQIFDSIPVGPNLSKQLIEKTIDPFSMYLTYATIEQLTEVERIKNLLRINGENINSKIPKAAYYDYTTLKIANSSLGKMHFLDNLEKFIWQQYFLLNLTLSDKHDSTFLVKKNKWKNYKPGKLLVHETKPQNYVEYTSSNRFSSLAKAILYPENATVYLYSQEDKVVDSFKVKKEKVSDLLSEKQDVFALYRNYLEWQLQNVTTDFTAFLKENKTSLASNTVNRNVTQQIDYYENDYWNLQEKIPSAIIPDKDLLALNVLDQANSNQRKKWSNENGWQNISPPPPPVSEGVVRTFTRGNKEYFLTEERGNVLATVSDKKIQHSSDGVTVDYYEADVVTATDYAPFGSQLPGRTYRNQGQQLRYGYNGKENDNEIKGEGNQQDYGFRIYDPRLGRFLSVDPLTKQYPHYTPYSYAGNKPIAFIDRDGLEEGLEIATRRREEAYLSGKISADVYSAQTRASGAGGVIGAAIAVDVFITKGRITQFLLASQVLGHLYHNKSPDPAENARRNNEIKNDIVEIGMAWGVGKLLGVGLNITSDITKLATNRFNFAKSFYQKAGYTEERFINHARGIDLAQKVDNVFYEKGTELIQWRLKDKVTGEFKAGDYYSLPNADPAKLGIDLSERTPFKVTLNEKTEFLKSTTADIKDTWSKPGQTIETKGGETQLFQTNVNATTVKQ